MAIDYANLFADLGKLVKHFNLLSTDALAFDSDFDEIEDQFSSTGQTDNCAALRSDFDGAKGSLVSLRQRLIDAAILRLTDRDTIVEELDLPTNDIATVLAALIRRMNDDSESINASVLTVGSVTADAGNVGNGTILTTKVLDGASSPAGDVLPHPEYAGLDSEFGVPETITLTCVTDSYGDGIDGGSEQFQIDGEFSDRDAAGVDGEGSGNGPIAVAGGGSTIISNGDLEDFTANVPDNWSLYGSSTAGTHVLSEASEFYRGAKSLELAGDAALASLGVEQAPVARSMVPLKRYCVTLRYKASATQTASQHLICQFEGTGYTAGSSEKIDVAGDVLATSWTLQSFFVNVPANLPSDWKLVVKLTGTAQSAKQVWIDDVFVTEVVWHGGVGFAIAPGSTPFAKNDKATIVLTKTEGVFQGFFRKALRVQLPSDNAAGETRADSLAT